MGTIVAQKIILKYRCSLDNQAPRVHNARAFALHLVAMVVIGPATVGGIQVGAFKIGDTAGTIDNIIQCKLYRPGSVGFVSKSGGMSNELYNPIARVTDGIYEGIAIRGDVFPGSTLSDHVLRFNNIPQMTFEQPQPEIEEQPAASQAYWKV